MEAYCDNNESTLFELFWNLRPGLSNVAHCYNNEPALFKLSEAGVDQNAVELFAFIFINLKLELLT